MARKFPAKRLLDNLARIGAEAAVKKSKRGITSKTLKEHVYARKLMSTTKEAKWAASMEYYWAVFRNDGTKPKTLRKGKFFAIFPNPADDPRHRGNYPKRLSGRKKLNLSRKRTQRLKKAGKLYFTRSIPATKADKFFDNDGKMFGFGGQANKQMSKEFSREVRAFLGPYFKVKSSMTFGV